MKKCFDHVWSFWRIIDQIAPFWELKSITGPNSLIKTSPFFQKYAKIGLNIMKKCILSMLGCFNLNPLEKKTS